MSQLCCCKGGFCELVLPNNNNNNASSQPPPPSFSNKKDAPLSKRAKRLQKSRERDRAIRLLKWVLTENEYSSLEESGDLVRLRVKPNGRDDDGHWIDGEAVKLARKEHRPDLARLAFAEFQSSLGVREEGVYDCDLVDVINNNDSKSSAAAMCESHSSSSNGGPRHVTKPIHAANDGDAIVVCGVCFNVYTLLRQARDFLASYDDDQQITDEQCGETTKLDGELDQDTPSNQQLDGGSHQSLQNNIVREHNNLEETTTLTTNNHLKRASSEGPNSSQWNDIQNKKSITSAASFHGPTSPQHSASNNKRNGTAKSNRKARRRKRDRKQMEENSKINILVAESDEVRSLFWFLLCMHQK